MSETRRVLPVLRALLWKEWRQLRLLRFIGAGLCFAIPPLLLAAAAASRRGLLPTGPLSTTVPRDILLDAVPPVMVTIWGVLTLFVVAQCFAGDRAAGLEPFLLASPVRRRWVFCMRLVASAGAILTTAVAGLCAWVVWSLPSAGSAAVFGGRGLAILLVGGLLTNAAAVVAGIAAAALVTSPLPAVLAGLVLALAPLGLGMILSVVFPYAKVLGRMPIGGILPLLLYPAFLWASFRVLCTGEPAGRGRYRRAGMVLGGAIGAVAVLFVALAPIAVSLAGGSHRDGRLTPCPTRALAFLIGGWPDLRGWLVDTSTGEPRHDFGLGVWGGSWSPDGRYLVVASSAGPLGMRLSSERIEIYDATRMQLVRRFSGRDFGLSEVSERDSSWTATHLVLAGWDDARRARLGVARLADWHATPLAVDPAFLDSHPWTLVDVESGGTLYLAVGVGDAGSTRWGRVRLHALDVETGLVSPVRLEQERVELGSVSGLLYVHVDWRLSPSGRYWITSDPGSAGGVQLLDVDAGATVDIEGTEIGRMAWLAADTLAWADYDDQRSRLRTWSPVDGAKDIHTAHAVVRFRFEASPDRQKLLTSEFDKGKTELVPAASRSVRIYDVTTGAWSEVGSLVVADQVGSWAGPDVLAFWTLEGLRYRPLN